MFYNHWESESIRWCSCRKEGGGGTSLCADVNKNSHFKPVCALTDHSKHYARHRGWTTLGYSTEIILHRARGDADKAAGAPLQVLFPFRLLTFVAVTRISVSCLVSGAIAPLPILSYVPVSGKEKKRGWGGGVLSLCRRMKKTSKSRFGSWWRLNVRRGASVTKHISTHPACLSILPASIHLFIGERVFSRSVPPFPPLSLFSSQMGGRSTPSQLGDFHATSPPSPQARGYKKPKPPHYTSLRNWIKGTRFRATTNPVGTHNL